MHKRSLKTPNVIVVKPKSQGLLAFCCGFFSALILTFTITFLFNILLFNRGPFITALGKIWCPEHFVCTNEKCKRPLQDIGFVEEDNGLYCEYCFEQYLAPVCSKCSKKIKGVEFLSVG